MADVEQRAEAEAEKKRLSGKARTSYIGGVFNRIREAHARAVKPGQGKTFLRNLNRRNRQLARARYKEALRPHEEAVAALKSQRKGELAQLSYEKPPTPRKEEQEEQAPTTPPKPARDAFPARDRQIRDAVKHGAPDFPPGVGQPPHSRRREAQPGERLQPVRTDLPLAKSDPFATPDVDDLINRYGEHQIGALISDFSTDTLRAMARKNGIAHPGHSRRELVRAIVSQATHGRYAGDFPPGVGQRP